MKLMRLAAALCSMALFVAMACAGGLCLHSQAQAAPETRPLPAEAAGPPKEALDYRLGAGDQLRVIVFNEPDLTSQFTVGAQGTVSFPLIGDIKAGNLTVAEFSRALEEALSKGFLKQPKVSIEVLNYRPFFILGEVSRPGTYPYSANLTVLNAVATAGGFTYRADQHKVIVKRANEEHAHAVRLTSSMVVQPGDTITIPERFF
jgi:protein involved in polysaccharide export with SLBB domain